MNDDDTTGIHSTAIIDSTAIIGKNVTIGPYCIVGPRVEIGNDTVLVSHVVVPAFTKIGDNNKIHEFVSLGGDPQDLHFKNEKSYLIIGDNNIFFPFCTINRGTAKQDLKTIIGSNNMFMAYTHVGHDSIIGNNILFSNNATLAGHVQVDDFAIIGAFSAIHQFCHIGAYSFITQAALVSKDVLPYVIISGAETKPYGLNMVGLKRNGFSLEVRGKLKKAYKIIFREKRSVTDAIMLLQEMTDDCPEVKLLIEGLNHASGENGRGILR
jgi:UDP-N-acetylglucosamine acyltransferase